MNECSNKGMKVVILEIGCGVQIKRVRNKSEQLVSEFRAKGINVCLFYIILYLSFLFIYYYY
jgi:hypothetical protein